MPRILPEYKEQVKEYILETAVNVFSVQGYHNTKIDEIARNMNVTKGTIYHYFESKEQLYVSSVIHSFQQRLKIMEKLFTQLTMEDLSKGSFFEKMLEASKVSFGTDLLMVLQENELLKSQLKEYYDDIIKIFSNHIEKLIQNKNSNIIIEESSIRIFITSMLAFRDGLRTGLQIGTISIDDAKQSWTYFIQSFIKTRF